MTREWLIQTLAARFGWNSDVLAEDALQRSLERRMERIGAPAESDYLKLLLLNPAELELLAEEFLVPETWFFREPETLQQLVAVVREQWRKSFRPVRILSLPCSTGEEPYSIAIALTQAGLPENAFKVEGVDLGAQALEKAKNAVYGSYSFRGGGEYHDSWFLPVEGGWQLNERIRAMVRFRCANLVDPSAFEVQAYDVVVCRNLLIYFSAEARDKAFEALARMLGPEGVLFMSACEAALPPRRLFQPHRSAGSLAFKKGGAPVPKASKPAAFKPLKPKPPEPPKAIPRPPAPPPPPPPPAPVDPLVRARDLADRGQLEEARALCEAALKQQGPSADRYYLAAVIDGALGHLEEARAALKRAIYLEPEHHEALLQLALYEEDAGHAAAAERLRARARRVRVGS